MVCGSVTHSLYCVSLSKLTLLMLFFCLRLLLIHIRMKLFVSSLVLQVLSLSIVRAITVVWLYFGGSLMMFFFFLIIIIILFLLMFLKITWLFGDYQIFVVILKEEDAKLLRTF